MARNRFSDESYSHYDPKIEGFGSAEEWAHIADSIADKIGGNKGFRQTINQPVANHKKNPDLELLLLDNLPATVNGLKIAFRNTMFIVHPDVEGGSNEACRNVLEAYERLLRLYQ